MHLFKRHTDIINLFVLLVFIVILTGCGSNIDNDKLIGTTLTGTYKYDGGAIYSQNDFFTVQIVDEQHCNITITEVQSGYESYSGTAEFKNIVYTIKGNRFNWEDGDDVKVFNRDFAIGCTPAADDFIITIDGDNCTLSTKNYNSHEPLILEGKLGK
jgi:hypothetical protein